MIDPGTGLGLCSGNLSPSTGGLSPPRPVGSISSGQRPGNLLLKGTSVASSVPVKPGNLELNVL